MRCVDTEKPFRVSQIIKSLLTLNNQVVTEFKLNRV